MPTTKFLILSYARTGSTLLCDVLGSSPQITCLYEALNEKVEQYGEPATDELKALRQSDVDEFVTRIVGRSERPIFGFKIFPGHADDWLNRALLDPDWKKIVLYRQNVMAVHSSYLIARARGVWSDTAGHRPLRPDETGHAHDHKLPFNPGAFDNFRRIYQSFYSSWLSRLAQSGQHYCYIEYNTMRNPRLLARVFAFLGAKPILDLQAATMKSGAMQLPSRYDNPEAVRAHLEKIGRLDWQAESFLEI